MRNRPRTLPIRRWLALALAANFLIPVLATVAVGWTQFGPTWHSGGEAAQVLRSGASRWTDPAWQSATRARLGRQGVAFVLFEHGREVYRSARDPAAGTDANRPRTVQHVVIGGPRRQVADIYSSAFGPGGAAGSFWLLPLVGLTTLLLTLGATAWFLRRTLVMPLAATSRAARQIAAGDLAITVPGSRVREVDELNAAFQAMSEELQTSLQRQAAVEEERRLFVGAIAHDLRTPLFSLRGYLEGLEQGLATTPDKMARYIRISREKADALERLIADLFAYTRIEYLEETLHPASLDLGALLGSVVEGRQREAEDRGVRLEAGGPPGCMVNGDAQLLARAVENVLDNALRYTPPGGRIEVRWQPDGDRVKFVVADTGSGIPPADLTHIFEPMYRADRSRSRDTGGTGLGLAIARRILRAHGGDLVAANRPSGGAEFSGSLPCREVRIGSPAEIAGGCASTVVSEREVT